MKDLNGLYHKIKSLKPKFDKISPELLIAVKYDYPNNKIIIETETQEFTCVCPWSGLPDYGILRIKYVPKNLCVELKSLKYYIQSYRNVGIMHENALNKIFDDLWNLLKPRWLYVEIEFFTRGGITTIVKREKGVK
ncbi:MAG: preQ(1) synthase [Endomicrobia bacterium]|nr:preQ(1) synthase [Endomicrobiia bacterium]MDW8055402.1 preQ(1) synthase [Elusimicrobiota bacterium]